MAEMDTSSGGGHKKGPGVKKSKKMSTRVDLTPMVDLGFLLITFFIFTTTMAKPKTMEINMPNTEKIDPADQTKIKASTVITVLLSKNHRIYYYEGLADNPEVPPDVKVTGFKSKDGIRDVIIGLKAKVESLKQQGALSAKDQATVLIKPDVNSTYADMVNILDEMSINDVRVYAIVDITPVDQEFISLTEAANPGN
jgi:biopolymer transport protein ExbD